MKLLNLIKENNKRFKNTFWTIKDTELFKDVYNYQQNGILKILEHIVEEGEKEMKNIDNDINYKGSIYNVLNDLHKNILSPIKQALEELKK